MNKKEFYDTLSEDVKTKIKACKTEDEMMKVLAEEKIELDTALLGSVSGGACSYSEFECGGNKGGGCYEDCNVCKKNNC